MDLFNDLILLVVDKRELRGLSNDVVLRVVAEYKSQFPLKFAMLEQKNFNPKSQEFSDFKKFVRRRLRSLHGVFQKNKLSDKKRNSFLEGGVFDFDSVVVQKFLKSHLSSYERKDYYRSIYAKIEEHKSLTSVMDLGCGLNPLSFSLFKDLKRAFCVDINVDEVNFLNDFFSRVNSFKGEAVVLDLSNADSYKIINEKSKGVDCVFLFKLLDSLESSRKSSSAELLRNINSNCFVVSFSNKTISGKNNIVSERFWFKKIVENFKSSGKEVFSFSFGYEDYYLFMNS